MRMRNSFLRIPHSRAGAGKMFFGQLLVETPISRKEFANEAVNAVINQAELNGKKMDYAGRSDALSNPLRGEYVLRFSGDIPGYLKVSEEDAKSFHVSFREATEQDKAERSRAVPDLIPDYVLTLSITGPAPGEFADSGFWGQLGNCLFTGISTLDELKKQDPRLAIVFGNEIKYEILEMGRD